jgi:hypothetical protein
VLFHELKDLNEINLLLMVIVHLDVEVNKKETTVDG